MLLQREHHVIRELDATIVGCTLWSRVNSNAWNMMNDKHCAFPRDGLPGAIQAHERDLEYLNTFLDSWKSDMLTRHHDSIDLWCCGHTHTPATKEVCSVLIVCSPVGYLGERPHDEAISEIIELTHNSGIQGKSARCII